MGKRRVFGNIRKRSSGRYQASYLHLGQRLVAPQTFKTVQDADKWLSGVRTDINRGAWVDPRRADALFTDYAEDWLVRRPHLRPRTVTLYQSLLHRHLVPAFGSQPMGTISVQAVRDWNSTLRSVTPGAAASAYRLLRAIFATAVRDEVVLRSTCQVMGAASDRSIERPMMTVANVQALSEAVPNHLRAAVLLAGWGGLRRGEVLALRRKDLDVARGQVRIERAQTELNDGTIEFSLPKTDAGVRTVHLPRSVMLDLQRHLDAFVGPGGNELLFPGRGAVSMRPRTLSAAFRKAREVCGLPGVRFHDLRHFALTMAATTGASTKELMRRAGHASPAAALRYQHATDQRDQAIASALEGLASQATITSITQARASA